MRILALLACCFVLTAQAALTTVNPSGGGNGGERCLAGSSCSGGDYSGAFSIVRSLERDLGLAAGTLQRVDDSFDRRWIGLGPQAALRPFARYAGDNSTLGVGVSSGGVTTLTGILTDSRVWVNNPSRFASDAESAD